MNSGPICAMVWEGRDAVKTGRVLLGATNPLASAPGTIRGDFAIVSYPALQPYPPPSLLIGSRMSDATSATVPTPSRTQRRRSLSGSRRRSSTAGSLPSTTGSTRNRFSFLSSRWTETIYSLMRSYARSSLGFGVGKLDGVDSQRDHESSIQFYFCGYHKSIELSV